MTYEPHPLAGIFPLIEGEPFRELVEDVRRNGVRVPVVLHEGQILDGRNRQRAAREAGVECPVEIYTGDDPLGYVISLNVRRRHLDESQRAMIADGLATMRQGQRTDLAQICAMRQGQRTDLAQICAMSQAEAAERMRVSRRAVQSARTVRSQGTPELVTAVESGVIAVSVAAHAARLSPERQREALVKGRQAVKAAAKRALRDAREVKLGSKIVAANAALPALGQRFGVIYADPPWRFEPRSRETGMDRAADNHYPTMPLAEIIALGPKIPAAESAVLFLWATVPGLVAALDVMQAWGFDYKSHWVWMKSRFGTGYWSRNLHEILLIGTKGTELPAPAAGTQPLSVIGAPVSAHSTKPERFREIIEHSYPTLPKLELFARTARPGWIAWGAESPLQPVAVVSLAKHGGSAWPSTAAGILLDERDGG